MSAAEKNDAIENVNYLNSIQECLEKNFAVIEFTTNGEIVTANENFLATVGYTLSELKGKHHRVFVSNEYANSDDYHNFWQRIAAGESFKGEFERFGKNNKRVWLDAVYAPIKDATGKVTGAFKIASDITQIKEMAKLKQMVDLAPINMMLADPKGKMTYMNDASRRTLKSLEKLLPASVEQLVGNSVDWFHKNPEHNRAIFSNPNKLPHKKIIQLGPEKLELLVSPVFDHNQVFVGPMVSWEVVTERVKLVEELTNTSEQLASASEELLSVAQTMSSSAEETAAQASTASSASEQISAGIQSVATNMEEMTASIREITKNTNSASTQSSSALDKSTAANKIIEVLGESSNDIGNIIKVITSIAQQTNLLALNATIEAARAGEAGKGFAVVANEVKELAKQTANATEDISKKIEAIQNDSQSAVGSIGSVSEAMEQLNGIASSIASAMEEQAATTNEVSRVVTEATTGVNQITQTIQQVNVAAEQTGRGAADMTQSANDLNKIAQNLNQLIERFKIED